MGVREFATIVFILISVALAIVIMMQEGKSAGLSGSVNGIADTYWGKNKGRSIEGKLEKITKVLAILFFVVAGILSFYHH